MLRKEFLVLSGPDLSCRLTAESREVGRLDCRVLGYLDGELPIMGLPGPDMFEPYSLFDVVLPIVLAGEMMSKQDFIQIGHDGLIHK